MPDPHTFETIRYELVDQVAVITLNRPDRLNAFNRTMMDELLTAFDLIDSDDTVRAVVVTGQGRGFCAGADLESGGATFDYADEPDEVHRDGGGLVSLRIFELTKPIIAAINGPAVGVGITMTLPMDVRLVAESARIGFVFARRGISLEAASSWFLPRLVGISQAAQWCYSGRVFSAAEAESGGLAQMVPDDELLDRAMAMANEIASFSAPVSVAMTRQLLWRGLTLDHPMAAHRADSRAINYLGKTDDAREGIASFLEKREPRWTGQPSSEHPDLFPDWDEPTFS